MKKTRHGWRRIESAPRDGTQILLLTDTGIVSAWWNSDEGGTWVCYDDKFSLEADGSSGEVEGWMPLPQLPKKSSLAASEVKWKAERVARLAAAKQHKVFAELQG